MKDGKNTISRISRIQLKISEIIKSIKIPAIGIGVGPHCDGQVPVLRDLLGLFTQVHPKFVRRYADLTAVALDAFKRFKSDVEAGKFPNKEESYE